MAAPSLKAWRPVAAAVALTVAVAGLSVTHAPEAHAALQQSTGNLTPTRTISGLAWTTGLAVKDDLIYAGGRGQVTKVFEAGLTGSNTPVRTLTDTNDTLGLAVRSGRLYSAGSDGSPYPHTTQVYPSGVNGGGSQNAQGQLVRSIPTTTASGVFVNDTHLWVSEFTPVAITKFAVGDSASNTAVSTISGGNTQLSHPRDLLIHDGYLYVASANNNRILVFDASATGDASPVRVITGASTELNYPWGLEVIGDQLFVSNYLGQSITSYPLDSEGDVEPTRTISGAATGLDYPGQIESDAEGNLYVANQGAAANTGSVVVFDPTAPDVATATPATGRGGTSVTITGEGFTGATAVSFGGTAAAFTVDSDTQITAIAPSHAAGSAAIEVVGTRGTGRKARAFTFSAATASDTFCDAAPALVNADFDATFPSVGWDTTYFSYGFKTIDTTVYPEIGWRNLAEDSVELVQSGANNQYAHNGNQYAEINGSRAGTLYQDVATTPGTRIHWSLYHRARNGDGPTAAQSGTNTMRVLVGAAGGLEQQGADRTSVGTQWTRYSGQYTVPMGQTTTRFAVASVSSADPAVGNLLDATVLTRAGCASAPTSLWADPGSSSATIHFAQHDDGGDSITNYAYQVDGGTWTALPSADGSSPITIPGLTPQVAQSIRIRPMNSIAAGAISDPVTVTPYTTPSAPSIASGTRLDANSMQVTTTPAGDGGSAITDYQYSLDGGSWTSAGASATFTVTGLNAFTAYSVRVRAVNAAGPSSPSAAVDVVKAVPDAPTVPQARLAPGASVVQVFWRAPAANTGPITSYRVQAVRSDGVVVRTCYATTTRCTVGGLPRGVPVRFRIAAANPAGRGDESTFTSYITLAPPAPSAPIVSLVSRTRTRLTVKVRPGVGTVPTSHTVRAVHGTTKTCTVAASTGTCSLTALTPGTAYAINARATNAGGTSIWNRTTTLTTLS